MKKKLMACVLAAVLSVVTLAGCGGTGNSGGDTSSDSSAGGGSESAGESESIGGVDGEGYEVNFAYIVSNTQADQDKVNQALSDLAERELNMKVNVIALTYVDALNQIPLMLASGSGLDIFPSWSNTIGPFIDSGYVEDLAPYRDLLVHTKEWMTDDDLACCIVQDVQWGIPMNKEQASCETVFMRKDILDELNIEVPENATYDDITNIFEQVHVAYPDMTVFGGASYESLADMGDVAIGCDTLGDELGVLANYGAEPVVVNEFETDSWREAVDVMRTWYEAGYVSKDMPTSQDTGETMIASGILSLLLTTGNRIV